MMVSERYLLLTQAIHESINNLRDIRERFADDPIMLEIYESSSLFAMDGLKRELAELLNENRELPDLMIRLKGEAFEEGRAPARVIADFLRNLTVATQHAFSILHQINTEKGRPPRHIQDLAQFELAGISKGSFVLELQKPPRVKKDAFDMEDTENDQLFDAETISNAMDKILYGEPENEDDTDGFLLLMKALRGTEEDVNFLEEQLGNNTLTLLHYAKNIAPSSSSVVDEMEFAGRCLKKIGVDAAMVVDRDSRRNLEKLIFERSRDRKIVEGYGWLNELDVDRNTGILREVVIDKKHIEELRCTMLFNESGGSINPRALSELVQFKGLLTYSKRYEPTHIELFESDFKIVGEQVAND